MMYRFIYIAVEEYDDDVKIYRVMTNRFIGLQYKYYDDDDV